MKFQKDYKKAKVSGLYLSKHIDLNYSEADYLQTKSVESIDLTINGIENERHYGLMELSDSRVKHMYEKGTEIRNNRQWTGMSVFEKEKIEKEMKLEGLFKPEQIGINILIDGFKNLSALPPLSYLFFSKKEEFLPEDRSKVVLVVFGEILPCSIAGKSIAIDSGLKENEQMFPKKSIGYRGTSGWIEKGGRISLGDNVFIFLPTGKT
jgi:hypothetical protein